MKGRILLLGDQLEQWEALNPVFEGEGFHVDYVPVFRNSDMPILEKKWEILMCDISDLEISQETIIQWIRGHDYLIDKPLLVFAERYNKEKFRQYFLLGADDCLVKPIDVKDLMETVIIHFLKRQQLVRLQKAKLLAYYSYLQKTGRSYGASFDSIVESCKGLLRAMEVDANIDWNYYIDSIISQIDFLKRLLQHRIFFNNAEEPHPDNISDNSVITRIAADQLTDWVVQLTGRYKVESELKIEVEETDVVLPEWVLTRTIHECIYPYLRVNPSMPLRVGIKSRQNEELLVLDIIVEIALVDLGKGTHKFTKDDHEGFEFIRNILKQSFGRFLVVQEKMNKIHGKLFLRKGSSLSLPNDYYIYSN